MKLSRRGKSTENRDVEQWRTLPYILIIFYTIFTDCIQLNMIKRIVYTFSYNYYCCYILSHYNLLVPVLSHQFSILPNFTSICNFILTYCEYANEHFMKYLRLLLLAVTNFSILVVCCIWQVLILVFLKWLVMFFLFITGKFNEIERRTNSSGYLI